MISDIAEAIPDRSRRMLQDDMRGLIEAQIVDRFGQTRAIRYRLRALS
jgi:DNA-binding HxlR family transcriptional regulator